MIQRPAALAFAILCGCFTQAQSDYSNFQQQSARINAITKSNPQVASVKSIAKTAGGKDVWMITLGSGKTDSKPAIAVIGGVQGNHLLGTELALGFAEQMIQSAGTDSIKKLLESTTWYVFPNISPDAMEQYFSKLKYERLGNATSTDDDRDGRTGEDEFDDLDGNGKINWLRIESPLGTYIPHPDDARALIKADLNKGEKGKYLLIPEGTDNDKDGEFNEDGDGGVAINKNLSFRHPSFTKGSGEFAVSEIESRALLDALYNNINIYALVSFGPENNLSSPIAFNAAAATQRLVAGYLEPDSKVNAIVSELYNKITAMKDAPKNAGTGGDLLSWGYYHYGRFSFSTPGWFVPKAKADTTKKEKALSVDDPVANYLRFAGQQGITNSFAEWKPVQHPDFPGQKVELGGIDPFVLVNPPYKLVPEIIKKHNSFLVSLAGLQPSIDILNLKTEKVNGGLTRITATIANKGILPANSALGEKNYWLKRVNVKLETSGNQSVISGKKSQLINNLEGQGSQQLTWLVKGSGSVTLEAGSPTAGIKRQEIKL
ncbi:MAG: peptidase [Chitinophagaceae bacterium]|nr:MAG: peptidase [Chitinophagaceae bacterium]